MNLDHIYKKAQNNERLTTEDALILAEHGDFLKLAELANQRSKELNGNRVAYLIDCNINYTNICRTGCQFCAFSRPKNHAEAWELSYDELDQLISQSTKAGCHRVLLQGGMHPDHKIDDYEKLISHIKKNHDIHIHAFSPPEIDFIANESGISIKEAIERLIKAGLTSIPGGGAEILSDDIRGRVSPKKCSSQEWLDVMAMAHKLGLKTTATMMMGHVERWAHRISHLRKLRDLQDQTEGFISFIAWTFQPGNTALDPSNNRDIKLATAHEYLRLVSITRLFLDNFKHIQASALTQGDKIAQISLNFGADDIGSIMLEEKVVASAGCNVALEHSEKELVRAISESGHTPFQRDTMYNELRHKA